MGIACQLREVEDRLIKDLEETTLPLSSLGKKYGVSKQAIFQFVKRKGINRPKREHTENCSFCGDLMRIPKKPHSDFISYQTIKKMLGFKKGKFRYYISFLRGKGLISQKFGRLKSKRVELAYQIYFKKRLSIRDIERHTGLKNFRSLVQKHRVLGWHVPDSLIQDSRTNRIKARLKVIKRKTRWAGQTEP